MPQQRLGGASPCARACIVRVVATAAALLVWSGTAGPAWAQARAVEDIVVEQSRIVERFSPPPAKGSASLRVPPLAERISPELAAQTSLVLRDVRIEGATEMAPDAFRRHWAELVGREIPVSALFELTARIERQYREAGILVMASVPDQDLSAGVVRIVVFDQSYIETVETRGDYPDLRDRIDPYVGRIVAMQPLLIERIERILLLMSDLAGMNIEASLRRPERPGNGGALTLEIAFEKRVARFSLDNRGTDEVGPFQAFGTYQENDLFGLFESTTFTGATIPNQPRELLFGQVAQDFPIGRDGLHLGYRADAAHSRPGGALDDLDVDVASYTAAVYASYPVLRTIGHSVWTRAELSARNTDVDVLGQTASRDHYRWLSAGLDSEHDTGLGPLALEVAYLHGIDAFGATGKGSSLASREGADTAFQAVKAGADLSVALSDRLTVIGRAAGQHAFGPLPAEVQMSFGGEPFGRAFDSGAASGDSAVMGSLELTLATDIPVDVVVGSAAYGFVDYAALWYRGDDRPDAKATLGSAGAGFRVFLENGFAADASLAVPVDRADGADDPGLRVFFALRKRF